MSQMTATARPLRAPRRGPAPVASLRVLPARMASTGSGAFATLCIVLLTAGLIALLVLNTALAQGSIALGQLQRDSARLTDTAGNLQEQIDRSSASGALARSAAQLGMVRMSERGYIDLAAGTVTGEPKPATKDLALPIVTSPTPLEVTKEVKGLLSSRLVGGDEGADLGPDRRGRAEGRSGSQGRRGEEEGRLRRPPRRPRPVPRRNRVRRPHWGPAERPGNPPSRPSPPADADPAHADPDEVRM